jgi:hypothetical protein
VAKDKVTGKIVGTQSAIPIEIVDGNGKVTLTAKSEDTLVHQDFRGMDIFNKMYALLFSECEKKGIKIIWGFTTAKKPFSKLGFDTPYSISQCLMVCGFFSSLKYLSQRNPKRGLWPKFKTVALCALSKIKTAARLFVKRDLNGLEHHLIDRVTLDNSVLINNVLSSNKGHFMIKQDNHYLRWRVLENPYHQKFFGIDFTLESRKVANILFNHHTDGVWYLIQDLYSTDLDKDRKAIILNKAISILKKNNVVNLLSTWDFTHNEINKEYILIKKRIGFVNVKKGSLFVWKDLDKKSNLRPENFILSRIASEGTI